MVRWLDFTIILRVQVRLATTKHFHGVCGQSTLKVVEGVVLMDYDDTQALELVVGKHA